MGQPLPTQKFGIPTSTISSGRYHSNPLLWAGMARVYGLNDAESVPQASGQVTSTATPNGVNDVETVTTVTGSGGAVGIVTGVNEAESLVAITGNGGIAGLRGVSEIEAVPTLTGSGGADPSVPELPRAYVDTTYADPSGSIITVNSGGNFQAALNSAQPGDTIVVAAGATFVGPFTVPNKTSGSGWIYVRTSALPGLGLPLENVRILPSDSGSCFKITAGSGNDILNFANSAHHFRFIGMEVLPQDGTYQYYGVAMGNSDTTVSTLPNNITFDRCYVHGRDSQNGILHGMKIDGRYVAVVNSYIANCKNDPNSTPFASGDSQAIWASNGDGPYKINNNYIEGASENVMFGGAEAASAALIPSDIEIRYNHFFKPLSWTADIWQEKNLLEFKDAQRIIVEYNRFENNPAKTQNGFAILVTPRNENNTAPWSVVQDATFRYNRLVNVGQGFNLSGRDDGSSWGSGGGGVTQWCQRVLIEHNLILCTGLNGAYGRLFGSLNGLNYLTIRNNTAFSDGPMMFAENVPKADFFTFANNIITFGNYGFTGTGTSEGIATLTTWFNNYVYTKNAIIGLQAAGGSTSNNPGGNYFPVDTSAVQFVDYAGGDYRLASGSPYKDVGTDGKDLGADMTKVAA
jgi:hypothetical protein